MKIFWSKEALDSYIFNHNIALAYQARINLQESFIKTRDSLIKDLQDAILNSTDRNNSLIAEIAKLNSVLVQQQEAFTNRDQETINDLEMKIYNYKIMIDSQVTTIESLYQEIQILNQNNNLTKV